MILLEKWLRKKTAESSAEDDASAIEYVDWLMTYMQKASQKKILIQANGPLPGAELTESKKAPPCLPSVETVLNRLKLLSGLNPVYYDRPKTGRFKVEGHNYELSIRTRFDDTATSPTCTIERKIRPRSR